VTSGKDISATRRRRVTAQTVADAAGVSRSAVSRAFTEGAYLDAEKRQNIRAIAAQLGYQPNALAAGLQGGRSHLVAIFVGNMRSAHDSAFVSQLVAELNRLNKWPVLIDGGGATAATAIAEVLRYPLDALILRGGSMSAEIVSQCAKVGIPTISSGRPIREPGVDNVCCRNGTGMREATRFLIDRGRCRFGFVAGPEEFYASARRRAGVVEALEAAGLDLIAEAQGGYTVDGGYQAAQDMLQSAQIDALHCANDASAIGALAAARAAGIAVPDALSVIGFDDIEMAGWPLVNLTTLRNPISRTVDQIIRLLERRLADPSTPGETVFLTPELIQRGTH